MADNRYRERGSYGRSDSIFSDDDRGSGYGGRDREGGRGEERGFFQRAGEEVRSWFSDDDDQRMNRGGGSYEGRRDNYRSNFGDYRGGGDLGQGSFSQSQGGRSAFDDHYRSWRDRQINQLDREYDEYCRHRQQQFESDFHSWRENRQGQGQQGVASGRTGTVGQSEGSGTTSAQSGGAGASAESGSNVSASAGGSGTTSRSRGGRSGKSGQ